MSDVQQLIDASRLYYELGETQSRVAELLGVTRPQVSRLLKRARAEGIVEIRIVDQAAQSSRRRRRAARAVRPRRRSISRPSLRGPEDVGRRLVGRLGGRVLRAAIRDGGGRRRRRRGVDLGGRRRAATSRSRETGATVVPLCGGYWFSGPAREPFRRIADALGGVPQGLLAPGLVDDPATKRSLVAHAGVRRILELWDRLDVAVFGIGGPAWSDRGVRHGDVPPARDGRRGRRGADGPVRPRRPVRLRRARATGRSRSTRASSTASRSGSASPAARRRSGRSSARCAAGSLTTLVTDVAHRRGGRSRLDDAAGGRPAWRRAREAASSAIDLGTTEVKAGLVTLDGRLLGLARAGYGPTPTPRRGRAEQDPEAWWGALATGGPASCVRLGRRARSSRSAIDGHGPTLVAVDADGRPTRPGDHLAGHRDRPRRQAELAAATGPAGLVRSPGCRPRSGSSATSPAAAAATRWYLATWDSLALRLTGRAATSLSPGQPFPDAAVARCGRDCPPRRSRRPSRPATVLGELTPERGATQLGLRAGIPVVAGLVDALASFHGAGMTATGDAIDVGGAAGGFGVYSDRPLDVPGRLHDDRAAARACTRSAARWPRPAGRSTGSGPTILGGVDSTEALLEEAGRDAARRRRRRSSCRTSPASARRSGTRRRAARSSG